jgi:hypothetical protein
MTYKDAIEIVGAEFELRHHTSVTKAIRTGRTLDGCNGFTIILYNKGDKVILTDIGNTKDVFDEVPKEEWEELCKTHGFEFLNWSIVRDFTGLQDVYDYIDFLDVVADKYCPLDEM